MGNINVEVNMHENIELTKIMADIIISKNRANICLLIVVAIIVMTISLTFAYIHTLTINFFSQYEYSYEAVIIDSGGEGDSIYMQGDNNSNTKYLRESEVD